MKADNSQQTKILELMMTLEPISRGTIRWVSEAVWEQSHPEQKYKRNPSRSAHPGCVYSVELGASPTITLLHGHSRRSGPSKYELEVKGLTDSSSLTYFTVSRHFPVAPSLFWTKSSVWSRGLKKKKLSGKEMVELERIETCLKDEQRREQSNIDSQKRFERTHNLSSENGEGR